MLSLVANPEDMSRLMTKPTKWHVRPAKTQINLGTRPVWSESSLSAWRKLGSLATHWVHSEDSEQTGQMPRLIWVFTGCTVILLVSSCRGSNVEGPDWTADSDFPNSWFPHKRQNKIPWLFPDMNSNFPECYHSQKGFLAIRQLLFLDAKFSVICRKSAHGCCMCSLKTYRLTTFNADMCLIFSYVWCQFLFHRAMPFRNFDDQLYLLFSVLYMRKTPIKQGK